MVDWFKNWFATKDNSSSRNQEFPEQYPNSRNSTKQNDGVFSNDSSSLFHRRNSSDDIFSLMEDFFGDFSQSFDSLPGFSGPGVGFTFPAPGPQRSLRDQVLKTPEEDPHRSYPKRVEPPENPSAHNDIDSLFKNFFGHSFMKPFLSERLPKQDTDLDAEIGNRGLDSILESDRSPSLSHDMTPFHRSHFTSESVSIITKADGSTEKRTTRRSSDGTQETTIITSDPVSGEKRTEIQRSDGTVQVIEDQYDPDSFPSGPSRTQPFPSFDFDEMLPIMSSFAKFFMDK